MKTMAYWVGLILVGLSGGRPDAALVNIVVIMYVVSFLFVMFFYVSEKLRRYYLIFLVLYLAFITKMLGFIWNCFLWNLAPSQISGWLAISGILIILGFVAGCKLIAYSMREEKDQITRGMLLRWLAGVLLTLLIWIILLVWRKSDCPYSSRSWLFGFCFIMLMIGIRMLLSRRWKWLWNGEKKRTS